MWRPYVFFSSGIVQEANLAFSVVRAWKNDNEAKGCHTARLRNVGAPLS